MIKLVGDDTLPRKNEILIKYLVFAGRSRDIQPMLAQCWSSVADDGPTLRQHWLNISCLLNSIATIGLPISNF